MAGTVYAGLSVGGAQPAAAEFERTSVTPGGSHLRSWTRGFGEHTG
jgi:hypothetical protein